MNQLSQVTAVICTRNSKDSIRQCLDSITMFISNIIVVDGGSTDGTLSILKDYEVVLLRDSGSGLGEARNLGVANVKTKYVLNCGADNVLQRDLVEAMIKKIESNERLFGVSCLTLVADKGYLAGACNSIWKTRFNSGLVPMIGTPNLFRREHLVNFGYSKARGWSDDEDICFRMRTELGAKFEIINQNCFEVGQASWRRLIYRYFHYGYSDFEIFSNRKKDWPYMRKLKSIFHPYRVEFGRPIMKLKFIEKIIYFPVYFSACIMRYSGWAYRAFSDLHQKISKR
jgi:glycosyltransferase involved in cell wall biosynthesis